MYMISVWGSTVRLGEISSEAKEGDFVQKFDLLAGYMLYRITSVPGGVAQATPVGTRPLHAKVWDVR